MQSLRLIRTDRPAQGLAAFACALAMGRLSPWGIAVPCNPSRLDRHEKRLHPGKDAA